MLKLEIINEFNGFPQKENLIRTTLHCTIEYGKIQHTASIGKAGKLARNLVFKRRSVFSIDEVENLIERVIDEANITSIDGADMLDCLEQTSAIYNHKSIVSNLTVEYIGLDRHNEITKGFEQNYYYEKDNTSGS